MEQQTPFKNHPQLALGSSNAFKCGLVELSTAVVIVDRLLHSKIVGTTYNVVRANIHT